MPTYVRGSNPIWFMVDLDGNACDDNCYLWVLQNTIPYVPAIVYQDESGTIPWASPIQFNANGTLDNNIYFDEDVVYRLEVRQNDGVNPPSQSDPLLYLIEDYSPTGQSGSNDDGSGPLVTNQITNPQFSDINFVSPLSLAAVANPDPLDIAPGWELLLEGTGNATITQVPLTSTTPTESNAPYALRINLTGSWTSAILRQRFDVNGVNWADLYLATAITARIEGAAQNISARIDDSLGTPQATLLTTTLNNAFNQYTDVALMPDSTNTDTPPSAYLDFKIILPTSGDVYLSSVHLVPSETETEFNFGQDSIQRQVDHTFHYYKPLLGAKPIPSHLIGWDFPRNPAQFDETTAGVWGPYAIGANKSNYVWDQTIVFQDTDNGFSVTRANSGAFRLKTEVAATQLAMVQYLEQDIAREILASKIAIHIAAKKATGADTDGIVSLWYTSAALPDMSAGTNNSLVSALAVDGTVTAGNGTWTEVPRKNNNEPATFTITSNATNEFNDIDLNGWDMQGIAAVETTTTLAIVVSFEAQALNDEIDFQSIALCSGDIATRPAPKSMDEALRECERYYEKSYRSDVSLGTVTTNNQKVFAMNSTIPYDVGGAIFHSATINTAFTIDFNSEKSSAAPNVSFYSPVTATIDRINLIKSGAAVANEDINVTQWTGVINNKTATYIPAANAIGTTYLTTGATVPDQGSSSISLHFVADSRIGIA